MATGLYSPVNLAQHGTSAINIPNIVNQGFIPKNFSWADLFQGGGKKVFTSTSHNLLSQYGDDVIDVISSARNLRTPFGGGIDFTKGTIGFGDEIASTVGQANKGMELARRLRAGAYANSPLARRLLQTGTTVNPNLGIGIFNNPFFRRALQFGSKGLGIFSLFAPSRELGSGEITPEFIQEQQDLGQLPIQQAIAQQQAETQQNIINQINQANQNNQGGGGGGGGGNVSGPAGMSGPSSSPKPRGPNLVNRAQGGIVSINNLIRRL